MMSASNLFGNKLNKIKNIICDFPPVLPMMSAQTFLGIKSYKINLNRICDFFPNDVGPKPFWELKATK